MQALYAIKVGNVVCGLLTTLCEGDSNVELLIGSQNFKLAWNVAIFKSMSVRLKYDLVKGQGNK